MHIVVGAKGGFSATNGKHKRITEMKNFATKFLPGVVLALAFACSANAGLTGDSVSINIHSFTNGFDAGVQTVTVGPGNEGIFFSSIVYDFGDTSFNIRSTSDHSGMISTSPADTVSLLLTSLDFGSPLTSVSVSTILSGVSTTFGADWATFTWNEQSLPNSDSFLSASFSVTAVPEPEIYAMMAAGLGLLGFAARRRKQKEAA